MRQCDHPSVLLKGGSLLSYFFHKLLAKASTGDKNEISLSTPVKLISPLVGYYIVSEDVSLIDFKFGSVLVNTLIITLFNNFTLTL
jgi:hypothetical protein